MKAIGPNQYKFFSLLAIFFTVMAGLFFLVLIPLIAPRDLKIAGILLIMGIAVFGLGVLVTLTAIVYLLFKIPKK
jgi:hypothetical protein